MDEIKIPPPAYAEQSMKLLDITFNVEAPVQSAPPPPSGRELQFEKVVDTRSIVEFQASIPPPSASDEQSERALETRDTVDESTEIPPPYEAEQDSKELLVKATCAPFFTRKQPPPAPLYRPLLKTRPWKST